MPKKIMVDFLDNHWKKSLTLIFLLLGICFKINAQNIKVDAKVDRVSMPIGAQTLLHVSAQMPLKTEIAFPEIKDSIGKIQLVKNLKPDTAVDKNHPDFQTVTHSYAVTSFDTGVYVIPQFIFHAKNGDFKTGTVTLQIKAVPVDTTKAFYDIKQPLAVSYTFWDWLKEHWLVVLITLAAVLLTAGLVYYYKKRPVKTASAVTAPILSADVIALNKLNELQDKKLWQQHEVKAYYSELTDILREYLEKRYHIKAQEQTTDEIFNGLSNKEITQENSTQLYQVLTLADLVKFAKQKPEAFENEQSIEKAISFIMQTKHQPKPVDHKEDLPE